MKYPASTASSPSIHEEILKDPAAETSEQARSSERVADFEPSVGNVLALYGVVDER